MRHSCGATNQNDTIDVGDGESCVTNGFLDLLHGFADKRMGHLFKGTGGQFQIDFFA